VSFINSRGDFCHGVGGSYFNINNVQIHPGSAGGWITDDTAAFIDGGDDWKVAIYDVPTRRITRGHPQYPEGVVATALFAGGGVYASWPGAGGVLASTGWTYPDSGLLGVGPDGAIAYKPSYQSNGPSVVRERDGAEWQLTPNHPYDLQLLGNREGIWRDTGTGLTVANLPMPQVLPGGVWFPQVFRLGGALWLGYYSGQYGVVAHAFTDPTKGYTIVPLGKDAWPAFRALDVTWVRCVWSNSQAEQAGQMTVVDRVLGVDPLEAFVAPPEPPDPPKPPDPPRAPKIVVESWDALMKAGVPWKLDTTIKANVDTNLVVTKDAADKLWLRAVNVAGSDQTGTTRQLTVEGPDVAPPDPPDPPEPEPPSVGRFWYQPNIGSDMLTIFDDVSRLTRAGVDVFAIPVQQVLTDETTAQLGPNTWPNLVAHDVVRKLAELGLPLVVEMGSVKPYDCLAQNGINDAKKAVQRVSDAGGVISAFSMDEPLTANQFPVELGGCHLPLDQIADAVSAYMRSVYALGPILVGWLEAWPEVSYAHIEEFFGLLRDRGTLPKYFHADIDHVRAENEREDVVVFIHKAQALCDQYGVTFGYFVNSTVDPVKDNREHDRNLVQLAHTLYAIHPTAAHVCVAAWCRRESTDLQDIPDNLPEDGLLQTFVEVRDIYGDAPPPEPPTPEIDMTFVTIIDNDQILAVTEVRPSQEKGCVYLVLADPQTDEKGTHERCSFSCQPPAKDTTEPIAGWRVEGTDGEYEHGVRNGNYLVVTVKGVRYAWPFTLVRA
jgi:hypothetical protein